MTSAPHVPKFRRLIQVATEGACTSSVLRIARADVKPLLLVVQPVQGDGLGIPQAAALVFFTDLNQTHKSDPILLQELFAFSPTESKIAGLLMEGYAMEHISAELAITENTARNHLKSLFAKTQTKKQAELLRMLLCSPAFLRFKPHRSREALAPVSGRAS